MLTKKFIQEHDWALMDSSYQPSGVESVYVYVCEGDLYNGEARLIWVLNRECTEFTFFESLEDLIDHIDGAINKDCFSMDLAEMAMEVDKDLPGIYKHAVEIDLPPGDGFKVTIYSVFEDSDEAIADAIERGVIQSSEAKAIINVENITI